MPRLPASVLYVSQLTCRLFQSAQDPGYHRCLFGVCDVQMVPETVTQDRHVSSILLVVRIGARKAHSGYHMNVRQTWACGCPSPECLQKPQKLGKVRKCHLEPPIHKHPSGLAHFMPHQALP